MWKREKQGSIWTPQCEVTDKHPFEWDVDYKELEYASSQRQPNLSHPNLNEEHAITWWKEISKDEYDMAKKSEIYE